MSSIRKLFTLLIVFATLCTVAHAAPEGYTKAGSTENVFLFGDQGYQIEYRYDIEHKFRDQIKEYIDNYNQYLTGDDLDVYLYFVNNSRSIDFATDMSHANDMYESILERLTCVDHAACLNIDSFETYMKYFYQTDHHWKYTGAQQGYEDILKLLLGPDETPYVPVETVEFNILYNRSYSKRSGISNSTEKFTVYRYDMPSLKVTVNRKKQLVDRQEQYFAGKYSKDIVAPHYNTFYGGDWGELVYETDREDRENLLVLCNLFSSPLRRLLPQHFHKTCFVDLRYYSSQAKKSMKVRQHVQENKIDKILILADVSSFLMGKKCTDKPGRSNSLCGSFRHGLFCVCW